ncbi:MAG: tRNA (adenosine(37)-N6)-threonylcarbamoyltransferase complex ATPase subunit type 1 TsaE [Pseudomonadota bacterium]
MADHLFDLTCPTPDATVHLAAALGRDLGAGDTLLLHGGIGAGKTLFARGLIQSRLAAAGRLEDVPSPTFTLVQTYWDGACEIWHADLYRLETAPDLAELGLDDAFETAICLIEWPGLLGDLAPQDALTIEFTRTGETARAVRFRGSDRWRAGVEAAVALARPQNA